MNKWGQALQSMAPSAPDPGMGRGNVPFAPGILSNSNATPGSSSELFNNLAGTIQGSRAREGMRTATAAHPTQPGADQAPQMAPPQGLQWTPEVQGQIMQYLMNMLKDTGRNWRMTTTGGTMNETPGY